MAAKNAKKVTTKRRVKKNIEIYGVYVQISLI